MLLLGNEVLIALQNQKGFDVDFTLVGWESNTSLIPPIQGVYGKHILQHHTVRTVISNTIINM